MKIERISSSEEELIIVERGTVRDFVRVLFRVADMVFSEVGRIPGNRVVKRLILVYAAVMLALGIMPPYPIKGEPATTFFWLLNRGALLCVFLTSATENYSFIYFLEKPLCHIVYPISLRRLFQVRHLWGVCYRFSRSGYYLIPLKQEPDPEKNIVFVSDSQVVGEKIFVSKERIAWGEYNGDHILIVAVPRKQPLLPMPAVVSSFLLESVHPEKEEIEAKLRQLGYELPLSGR